MTFNNWLDTLVEEKNYNPDHILEIQGPADSLYGTNFMPLSVVLDAIKAAPAHEQAQIKTTLVKIDFMNGDCMHFFKHLAQALAV